jgi:hypothetical protein
MLLWRVGMQIFITVSAGCSRLLTSMAQDFLVLILSGTLEGVVDEKFAGGPHLSHQVRQIRPCVFANGARPSVMF